MKHLLSALLALTLTFSLVMGQTVISISGNVSSTSTGAGLDNQMVIINLVDSLTGTTLQTVTTMTDGLGDYNLAFTAVNLPPAGTGEVNVTDCNGLVHSLHFGYVGPVTTWSNFDFVICAPLGNCQSAFVATTTSGSPVVNLTDYSTISAGTITQWFWTMGNGDTLYTQNATYIYPSLGTYTICLTVVTSLGCSDFSCQTVYVGAAPGPCQTMLTYGPLLSGGLGFTATGSGATAVVSYFYDFGDGNQLTTPNAEVPYSYPNGGTYNACVTALFSDSCMSTTCITVDSSLGAACQADFAAIPDTSGQFSVLIFNNCMGNNLQYTWDFGDGNSSTLAYPQHTYAGPGTYYICVTVVDSPLTCTASFCDSIVVINKINAPFTINVVQSLGTAVAPAASLLQDLAFSPNPAQDQVALQVNLARPAALIVDFYNLQGQAVQHHAFPKLGAGPHQTLLEINDLPAGIYLARVQADGQQAMQKIVVSR
jgi:PKD repeat protein